MFVKVPQIGTLNYLLQFLIMQHVVQEMKIVLSWILEQSDLNKHGLPRALLSQYLGFLLKYLI